MDMDLGQEKKLVKKARKEPEVLGALFDEYYPKIFFNRIIERKPPQWS
jgi:hypothetical protein